MRVVKKGGFFLNLSPLGHKVSLAPVLGDRKKTIIGRPGGTGWSPYGQGWSADGVLVFGFGQDGNRPTSQTKLEASFLRRTDHDSRIFGDERGNASG